MPRAKECSEPVRDVLVLSRRSSSGPWGRATLVEREREAGCVSRSDTSYSHEALRNKYRLLRCISSQYSPRANYRLRLPWLSASYQQSYATWLAAVCFVSSVFAGSSP
ncbi:hypothetical protein MY8738_002642 [Beauveria namnaoensis]